MSTEPQRGGYVVGLGLDTVQGGVHQRTKYELAYACALIHST